MTDAPVLVRTRVGRLRRLRGCRHVPPGNPISDRALPVPRRTVPSRPCGSPPLGYSIANGEYAQIQPAAGNTDGRAREGRIWHPARGACSAVSAVHHLRMQRTRPHRPTRAVSSGRARRPRRDSGRIEKSREDDGARGRRCPDATLGMGEARGVPRRYELAVSRRFGVDSHAEARALRAATRHVESNVGRRRCPSRSAMLVIARRCARRARPVPMHLCTVGSSTGVPVEADIQRQECTASSRRPCAPKQGTLYSHANEMYYGILNAMHRPRQACSRTIMHDSGGEHRLLDTHSSPPARAARLRGRFVSFWYREHAAGIAPSCQRKFDKDAESTYRTLVASRCAASVFTRPSFGARRRSRFIVRGRVFALRLYSGTGDTSEKSASPSLSNWRSNEHFARILELCRLYASPFGASRPRPELRGRCILGVPYSRRATNCVRSIAKKMFARTSTSREFSKRVWSARELRACPAMALGTPFIPLPPWRTPVRLTHTATALRVTIQDISLTLLDILRAAFWHTHEDPAARDASVTPWDRNGGDDHDRARFKLRRSRMEMNPFMPVAACAYSQMPIELAFAHTIPEARLPDMPLPNGPRRASFLCEFAVFATLLQSRSAKGRATRIGHLKAQRALAYWDSSSGIRQHLTKLAAMLLWKWPRPCVPGRARVVLVIAMCGKS
ncbi:hypothetical protein VTO73DRAFT_4615 [Trametes versicolor]